MYGWHQGYDYGYHGIGMFLVMLLFWIPLIGICVWLVARLTRSSGGTAAPVVDPDSARAILDRRLASGEISIDAYHELRRALESGPQK